LQLLSSARGDLGFVGLNVTTPFKRQAFLAADACADEVAAVVQAANVLICQLDSPSPLSLNCANTDGKGIIAALRQAGAHIAGSRVLLCGTGAVASVALVELIAAKASTITLLSREVTRAEQLIQNVEGYQLPCPAAPEPPPPPELLPPAQTTLLPAAAELRPSALAALLPTSTELRPLAYSAIDELSAAVAEATILIDATTVGTNPDAAPLIPTDKLRPGQMVLDVNYGHGTSSLLRAAKASGARALDGLEMLIEQAALSIELWAYQQARPLIAPRELMRAAALESPALEKR
jgi:shikimate dehydrogenase